MAKSAVGVVARIVAKPESVEIVRARLLTLHEPTRAAPGGILYE
jgi:quinol monooxygenase YgiN